MIIASELIIQGETMKRAEIVITPEELKKQLGLDLTENEVVIVKHETDVSGNLIINCVIGEK